MDAIGIFLNRFNANDLSYEKVGETYVYNNEFSDIATFSNTVIVGPRGCGKTTLLKMLTRPALDNWVPKDDHLLELKNRIDFIAIYIPSDRLYKQQLDNLIKNFDKGGRLVTAITTLNVLNSFISDIKKYIKSKYPIDHDKEAEFVENIVDTWELPGGVKRINHIQQELEKRLSTISAEIKMVGEEIRVPKPKWVFQDFSNLLTSAFQIFENLYCDDVEQKWVLCFDELELVPDIVVEDLIRSLRQFNQKIKFKLSIGPFLKFVINPSKFTLPIEDHDYKKINMWPCDSDKQNSLYTFSKQLIIEKLYNFFNSKFNYGLDFDWGKVCFGNRDYQYVFNKLIGSDIKIIYDEQGKEGSMGTLTWHLINWFLHSVDKFSFIHTIEAIKINPENHAPITNSKRQTQKLIKEILINRFLSKNQSTIKLNFPFCNSSLPIYYGLDTIVQICEGNPRWINNLLDIMLQEHLMTNNENAFIKEETQIKSILKFSSKFVLLLRNIPMSEHVTKGIHVFELISKIGFYFSKSINQIDKPFLPKNCFTVDALVGEEIMNILKLAMEYGAIIWLNPKKTIFQTDLRNETFRLSYNLSPYFNLPVEKYSSIPLSEILK